MEYCLHLNKSEILSKKAPLNALDQMRNIELNVDVLEKKTQAAVWNVAIPESLVELKKSIGSLEKEIKLRFEIARILKTEHDVVKQCADCFIWLGSLLGCAAYYKKFRSEDTPRAINGAIRAYRKIRKEWQLNGSLENTLDGIVERCIKQISEEACSLAATLDTLKEIYRVRAQSAKNAIKNNLPKLEKMILSRVAHSLNDVMDENFPSKVELIRVIEFLEQNKEMILRGEIPDVPFSESEDENRLLLALNRDLVTMIKLSDHYERAGAYTALIDTLDQIHTRVS